MRLPLACGGATLAFTAGLFAARIVPPAGAQSAAG
jgi:hypothetical protein